MSDRIEPALTAEQWAIVRERHLHVENIVPILTVPADMPRIIAVANDGLLQDDPRKITREDVEHLKRVHWEWRQATREQSNQASREEWASQTWRIIQALESYLPPEAP